VHKPSISRCLQRCRSFTSAMWSMLSGRTGRVYLRDRLLKLHPSKPDYNIYLAHCDNQRYIVKKVSPSMFDHSQELKALLGSDHRLRTHVDDNSDGRFLVYDYLKQDLLSLISTSPELNMRTRKHILKEVGSALHTLHSKGWIHLRPQT